MRDVFLTFLRLGITSFGGPAAHLGYFQREFVERRRWLDDGLFTHIVAFCSILPGPTSSQVGMIVGLLRAGPAGALAAWLGFTLPSALALGVAAATLSALASATPGAGPHWLDGLLAGFGAAATAIVALAVLAMAKTQCPDPPTRSIAAAAGVLAVGLAADPAWQWAPIAGGALGGALFLTGTRARDGSVPADEAPIALPRAVSISAAVVFIALIVAAGAAGGSPAASFARTIVRAGSLVFGGGHVVLPLLASLVPSGLVSANTFYAGYGLAQAMPGPLFTFAAFLGYLNHSLLRGALGAAAAIGLIFLPSFLLVFACMPIFTALRANRATAGALRGANAAVVGLLGALLYSPLITNLGSSVWHIALALAVFIFVGSWKVAPWLAVGGAALAGMLGATAELPLSARS